MTFLEGLGILGDTGVYLYHNDKFNRYAKWYSRFFIDAGYMDTAILRGREDKLTFVSKNGYISIFRNGSYILNGIHKPMCAEVPVGFLLV